MTRFNRIFSLAARATLAFAAGCSGLVHADADEPTLVVSQPIGQTIPGLPAFVTALPPVPFTFTLPDTPFTGDSTTTSGSGFTVNSSVHLNAGALVMDPASAADFNGIDSLTLTASKGSTSVALASYTRDPSKPAPGKTLTLAAAPNQELLTLISSNHQIQVTMTASGALPSSNWTANVQFDLRLHADANGP